MHAFGRIIFWSLATVGMFASLLALSLGVISLRITAVWFGTLVLTALAMRLGTFLE